ncbi:RNA-binding protein 5-A [Hypsizygus marmoreus]|uniref:RNA-binding protein 5-A n=1 Tax=Hypsizygus marmoreus TaxID=39966 RepID=A0A369JUG6_HYPMA|nr:RNA-binding protein 5-A [Hypsizygus marmoreus]
MAYNREWDQGKDSWNDGTWNAADGRANVRPREEDYYAEGKRRKFNEGGYQSYDNAQAWDEGSHDRGYNQGRQGGDHSQDYGYDDRQQKPGFANKKRLAPSQPSPHVIFLGLDPDFTEADLQAYLTANGCSVETVTIIRDRSSGTCIFVSAVAHALTFSAHARAFVDPLFPFIQVPPPASHGASATAAYYKALETGTPHNGRRVKIDYSQSASPHEKGRFNRGNMNDGTRDIGNAPAPVLLFRGLDPLSGPQAIHQAMLYSSGPTMQGAKGMKRIILIKDKVTMASFGFAFVEFVDVASASAVLAASMSPTIHPSGFRISDRPVAASFAHPYSFQPVTDFLSRDDACLTSSMSLGGVEGQWVRYWDENSTVAVLEFKVEEPIQPAPPVKEKREKKKKTDADAAALRSLPAAPSTLPVSDKPVTLSFSKGPTKSSIVKPLSLGFSMDDVNDASDIPDDSNAETDKVAAAKKVAPLIASKKTVSNINKWNQVQEELMQDANVPAATPALAATPGPSTVKPSAKPVTSGTSTPQEVEFEFSDVNRLMCLLCARQFKSLDQLKRHNKESDLHKARNFNAKNFKDPNLRDVARQKLAARKGEAVDQPKYRDRASERRVLFNQPDTPVPEKDTSAGKPRKFEAPPRAPSPPPPVVAPAEDASNIGNKMLKMMGWTEGSGLGTAGEGRVEPIQTSIYAQGVGLGASKGKDIGKYTEGYSGYVHMAQDAARERYGN